MFVLASNNIVQKYPYNISEIYTDNPNVSFPAEISDNLLAEYNIFRVSLVVPPIVDYTKIIKESSPVYINGEWFQNWEISNATDDEILERQIAKAESIRAERNRRLAACDWTQLADAPVNDLAWATYRQALRDIPAQAGFPWTVVWPTEP